MNGHSRIEWTESTFANSMISSDLYFADNRSEC